MTAAVTIALAQITGRPYAAAENRALTARAAREAFRNGAGLVVLPELVIPGYGADAERLRAVAEPLDGPSVEVWRAVAGESGGYVVGGFCELAGGELYNTAVLVSAGGVHLHYRKLHLFAAEKEAFAPGDLGLPVATLPFGTVGLCVCYDLRFVETVRSLALQGADLICVPTAWIDGFDDVRWDAEGLCPQARAALVQANLSQVFIACASQVGRGGGHDFLGSSIVADPRGRAVAGPLPGDREKLALVTVDLGDAERAQHRGTLITPRLDRRTDVYGLVVDGVRL